MLGKRTVQKIRKFATLYCCQTYSSNFADALISFVSLGLIVISNWPWELGKLHTVRVIIQTLLRVCFKLIIFQQDTTYSVYYISWFCMCIYRRVVLYKILDEFGIPRKLERLIKMSLTEKYSRVRVGENVSARSLLEMVWNKETLYRHWFSTLL